MPVRKNQYNFIYKFIGIQSIALGFLKICTMKLFYQFPFKIKKESHLHYGLFSFDPLPDCFFKDVN